MHIVYLSQPIKCQDFYHRQDKCNYGRFPFTSPRRQRHRQTRQRLFTSPLSTAGDTLSINDKTGILLAILVLPVKWKAPYTSLPFYHFRAPTYLVFSVFQFWKLTDSFALETVICMTEILLSKKLIYYQIFWTVCNHLSILQVCHQCHWKRILYTCTFWPTMIETRQFCFQYQYVTMLHVFLTLLSLACSGRNIPPKSIVLVVFYLERRVT